MSDKLFILFFITSAVWGTAIDGIQLPVIGSLFPLRIAVLLFGVILLYRAYVTKESVAVLQSAGLKTLRFRNFTVYTFFVLMVTGLITAYWAYNKSIVIVHLVTWLTSFACIAMCLTYLKDKENLLFAARIYTVNYLVIGGIGIYESFTGDYFNMVYEYYSRHKNIFDLYMPGSIMGNINNLAIFMVLSIPVCFVATAGWKAKSFWDILFTVFGGFVIVLTGCNTALILLCVVLVMYMFFHRTKKFTWVAAVLVLLTLLTFSSIVVNVFNGIIGFSSENEPRWDIWENAIGVASKYYFMGVGPGNSATVNILYKVNNTSVGAVHNYLLLVFEEFGFIGGGMFVWWLCKMIYNMFSVYLAGKDSLMKYALIFFVIFPLSTICMSTMVGFFYVWAEFGIFMAMSEIAEKEKYIQTERENK